VPEILKLRRDVPLAAAIEAEKRFRAEPPSVEILCNTRVYLCRPTDTFRHFINCDIEMLKNLD